MANVPTITALATALCKEFPETPSKTLARKLYSENKLRIGSFNSAVLAVRRARGAQGKATRNLTTAPRPKQKAGWKPECPPSAAEPWLPVQIDGPCKVLVISDVHIPYHDVRALEAAVAYGRKLKVDVVLSNGDWGDFFRISRFQQDPKKRTLTQEIYSQRDGLRWIKSRFPKARRIYKKGNHDERWDHFIWNRAPELFDLENVQLHNVLELEDMGFECVGDNPVMLGKLPVLHGHEFGKSGIAAPVNPARGAFLRTNHTVLIGHLHRPSSHAEPNMFHDETMTWSTGCLCGLQPEYARINKWAFGFAHVDVASDGQFNVHNYRISADYQVRSA